MEEWRDVPGLEGLYQASSLGRVKRLGRFVNSRFDALAFKPAHIFRNKPNASTGYQDITVRYPGGRKWRTSAHVLVCMAFHGPRPTPKHQVAHNDGSRNNNVPDNLRWATAKENSGDRADHGTDQRGELQWKSTLSECDVRAIRAAYRPGYGGYTELARKYGLTRGGIYRIVKRRNWKHVE